MKENKFKNYLLLLLFLIIISFPLINDKVKLVKDIASTENRHYSTKPKLNIKKLDKFPDKYDKYYVDNFSLRSLMVRSFNRMNIIVFQKSPFPEKALIGKDGWLFLAGNELDTYKGKNMLTDIELEAFKLELEYRVKYLEERNCKFYFLIAPVKANVYSEMMPNNIYKNNINCWGEQLNDYLKNNSKVNIVNVFQTLRNHKNKEEVYYKLDNHWNELGAFYAANEVLNRINKDFPNVQTNSIENYTISKSIIKHGNIVEMFSDTTIYTGLYLSVKPQLGFTAKDTTKVGYPCVAGFPYPWGYEEVKEIKNSKNPRILIISDSYGANIYPFLAEHFSRSVKIFDSWQYKLNEDIVNKEKPDVVLIVALEANMKNMLDYQSRKNK